MSETDKKKDQTESGSKKKTKKNPSNASKENTKEDEVQPSSSDDIQITDMVCKVCNKKFQNYQNFRAHKILCFAKGKKHICRKCGKGFHAKSLLSQHFDFRHTKKPKRFVCQPCEKSFELKKDLDGHNFRLHNTGPYRFQCDMCGRGFFHKQEFKIHRASHTKVKDFLCGCCKDQGFSSIGQLNAHLQICGKPNAYECNICGKYYSTASNLGIHVGDVYNKSNQWTCPICPNKVYRSVGGKHRHLRDVHKIGRNGEKLTDVLLNKEKEQQQQGENSEPENTETALESGTNDA